MILSRYALYQKYEDGIILFNTRNGAQVFIESKDISLTDDVEKLINGKEDEVENEHLKSFFLVDEKCY